MQQAAVERALEEAHREIMPEAKITRCAVARAVLVFLEELDASASWWERLVLGVVRQLVRRVIEERRPQTYL